MTGLTTVYLSILAKRFALYYGPAWAPFTDALYRKLE